MIKYSVIVPAYNAAVVLPQCLNALCAQTIARADYEIIVVDDGSMDETVHVAERILGDDGAQVICTRHRGPAHARNLGAQAASGQLLLFTDADCEPARDWIEQMVCVMNDTHIAGAKGIYRTKQRSLIGRFVQQEYQDKYDRMRGQSSIDFIDTYSAVYRRDVFEQNGGFNVSLIMDEDQEFSFRLAARGYQLAFAPNAIVFHQHVTSAIKYTRRKFGVGYWKALVLKRYPDKAVRDSHTPQVIKLQMALLAALLLTLPWVPIAAVVIGGLLLIAMLPFLIKIARRDLRVVLIAPMMIILRAWGLGAGLAVGLLRFYLAPNP